ncbi:ATP-binding protein [Sinomonas sp. ASV322]|uniref:ATP-binding protein n=1 Tax=Sinomonas sp. ASV322 TaxID=3041920 RepID=UPI0027DE2F61|nr:ATP-binding protein [Sinomonas sp. ASV322]MDQ4501508.1 ATP-binding protein [Sinomonas sp. ASV322]
MRDLLAEGHVRGSATPQIVDAVQDELARMWIDAMVIGPGDRLPFELAVIEVVTNTVKHARPPGGEVQLDLEVEVRADLLLARLFELGAWPAIIPEGSGEMPGPEAEAGRGLALARQLLTTITCERHDGANVWTLTLRPEHEAG